MSEANEDEGQEAPQEPPGPDAPIEPTEEPQEPAEPAKRTLMDDMRLVLMVTGSMRDPEIRMLVDAALADMRRVGVRDSLLDDEDALPPLVKQAVACYCKSRFGFDNPDFERFDASYRQIVCDLLNSPANEAEEANDDEVLGDGDAATPGPRQEA